MRLFDEGKTRLFLATPLNQTAPSKAGGIQWKLVAFIGIPNLSSSREAQPN